MANVNVNRNVTDQFYRYKMPKIIAKVEGKGNGIKTVIVNMPEVAKSLVRPPTYPTKYFGCELGAQTQFDFKNERFIVNGSHDSNRLQDLLDVFIKKFVLCPECDNPETFLHAYPKKGMITQRCIACGHQCNVDMRHKLTTFILKNPPDQEPTIGSTPNKKDKKKDKKGKKDSVNGEAAENEENTTTTAEPPVVVVMPKPKHDDEDDDDWGDDVSDAAVNKRLEELTMAAKNLALTNDLEKTQQERLDLFYNYAKEKKEANSVVGNEKNIFTKADQLEVKEKAPLILAEVLFDEQIASQIKQYRSLFLRFTHENQKAQRYLLGGFEQLVGNVYKDTLLPKVPHILKMLYDADILEEESIIDWDKKASKKYVSKEMSKQIHEKAAPFITWLKEAEEEEESSEEDEVEVVYSHTEKAGVQTVKPANHNAAKQEEEEDDDLDIDNI